MKRLPFAGRVLPLAGILACLATCLVLLFGFLYVAEAATSYRELRLESPSSVSWRTDITVYLGVDEDMCRRHYGNAWGSKCLADPIGIEGQVLGGVSMKPSVPGEWRWLYDGVVRFHTEGRFSPSPATEFVIDFSQARFLADVKLANPRTIYTTQPQAAFLDRELVWIEPSDKEAHGLSIRPMQPNRATRANDMAKFPLP